MTEIQAAIGLVQMGKLERFTAARRANAEYLTQRLKGVITPIAVPGCRHVYHQYTIRAPDGRDQLANHLRERGIGSSVYYPVPVHKQVAYQRLGYRDHLPVAENVSREVLSLPVHPALTPEDLDRIVEGVNCRWS
jgi:dTDP-4-amino-4,6-dideoxygalactose transaminase